MLKNSYIALMLLAGITGCSKEPDPTYSEPLEQGAFAREQVIGSFRAQPVQVVGYEEVFVAGPEIERKDCARCHKPGEEPYRDESLPPGKDAHWDIAMHHAADMECFSCHKKEGPAQLVSVLDREATLESGYLLCGSCHKDQFHSWLGGAHGKRVSGWNGVRVIMNCSACHNPHAPARAKSIPLAQPTIVPERAKGH